MKGCAYFGRYPYYFTTVVPALGWLAYALQF